MKLKGLESVQLGFSPSSLESPVHIDHMVRVVLAEGKLARGLGNLLRGKSGNRHHLGALKIEDFIHSRFHRTYYRLKLFAIP